MAHKQTELEMAERHVREAERHVERQIEIIDELRRDGHPTFDAESLLRVFEQTLPGHRAHLDTLRMEQSQA